MKSRAECSSDKEYYVAGILDWRKKVEGYIQKFPVKPKDARVARLLKEYYEANIGFDPVAVQQTTSALIKVERTRTFHAESLRDIWGLALNKDEIHGVANRPKAHLTLYNPKGRPFRIQARISAYVKATPVGIFALAFDIVINRRVYLKEGFINLKHVRWVKHPFIGVSKFSQQQRQDFDKIINAAGVQMGS